jgi:hypothetical protein
VGRDVGGLHRDVHRRVAHPEDHDALVGEYRVVAIGVRVQLLAGERVGPGKRRFRQARVPVVTVGDEQGVIGPLLATLELDLPGAILARNPN